jgi:hypothetical protein
MFGSSRSGFTWKEVADVLHVPVSSSAAIFRREIKRQRKGRVREKRSPVGGKDQQRSSNRFYLRQPGASRQG